MSTSSPTRPHTADHARPGADGPRFPSLPRRLAGTGVGAACLAILALAAFLRPASDGYGTHQQLGLAPCAWATGLNAPCPTCGMTTAFAHAAAGNLPAGFLAQPLGFLLAFGAAATFWGGLHVALTGSALGSVAARAIRPPLLWAFALLVLLAWGFKFVTWNQP